MIYSVHYKEFADSLFQFRKGMNRDQALRPYGFGCCRVHGPHTQNTQIQLNGQLFSQLSENKSTFVTEEAYSKILLRRLSPKLTLKYTAMNSNLKSAKFNLSNVNIGAWLNIATVFYQFISVMSIFYFNKWAR